MTGRLLLLLLLFLPGSLVSRLVRSFGECQKKKKRKNKGLHYKSLRGIGSGTPMNRAMCGGHCHCDTDIWQW